MCRRNCVGALETGQVRLGVGKGDDMSGKVSSKLGFDIK
jgi:hypothetical protein